MARSSEPGFSRRDLLGRTAAASAGLAVGANLAPPPEQVSDLVDVAVTVNGRAHRLRVDPRVTLLDALRERLGLTGTKKGCDRGQCGACTLHVDGRRVLSCLTLAGTVDGRRVTTIEGLADGESPDGPLHPVQQAFIDHDGFQCGFCTSGQIMSAVALLREHRGVLPDVRLRELMSGNLCRCGAYDNIVAAIKAVR